MTRDVDVVVEVKPADVIKIVGLFSKDCYIDQDSVRDAVHDHGMFNIIHNDWLIKADFIVRKDQDYRRKEFARRKNINIDGVLISVVAAEDLILSKLVWAKQSRSGFQISDVRQMTSTVSDLDWKYMKKWAAVLRVDDLLQKGEPNE
jgi:hypothetical protein